MLLICVEVVQKDDLDIGAVDLDLLDEIIAESSIEGEDEEISHPLLVERVDERPELDGERWDEDRHVRGIDLADIGIALNRNFFFDWICHG